MPRQTNLQDVSELIKYILFSDYLQLDESRKECPLSAIIIASVESGKTSVIEQFIPSHGILCVTDITAYGLQKYYLKELQWERQPDDSWRQPHIRRIVIPDLINPINRKEETASSLIAFLNAYISWEGVRDIATYAMRICIPQDKPIRGSVLTTMATQDFINSRRKFKAIGFLSRLLPICYSYNQETIQEILTDIAYYRDGWEKMQVVFPTGLTEVSADPDLNLQLTEAAQHLGTNVGGGGLRALHQLMILCRSRALAEGRTIVDQSDIDRVNYLCKEYIRLPSEVDES
uniref:Uncharacterized protein n=1 Tax=viral metagenome TaxID=1070528 RepID=A0A6H2A6X0_9ZZZZ